MIFASKTKRIHDTVANTLQQYNELGGRPVRDRKYDQELIFRQFLK